MPRVLCAALMALLCFTAPPAWAQTGALCIFSDDTGNTCNLTDTSPGLMTFYVVHTQVSATTAVQFSAPMPACMVGATWLADQQPWAVTLGDSQNGVSIGYGGCEQTPVHVLSIVYNTLGTTTPDCPYPVLPDPMRPAIEMQDCALNTVEVPGGTAYINSGIPCDCTAAPLPPTLQLDPAQLNFANGNLVKTFDIINIGTGVLDWDITTTAIWLSFDRTSGSGDATITATADPAGLPSGNLTGTITVTSNGGSELIFVLFNNLPPTLTIQPSLMDFGITDTEKTLNILNDGAAGLNWFIQNDATWITLVPDNGVDDGAVQVNVDRTGLTPGNYGENLVVVSNGGSRVLQVQMRVPGPALLGVTPTNLSFPFGISQQLLTISNLGDEPLNWNIASNQPWLSVSQTSGSDGDVVTAWVDRNGLPEADYSGVLSVTSNGGSSSVQVTMRVQTNPILSVAPSELNLLSPTDVTQFSVANVGPGPGTLLWTASTADAWIDLQATSGTGNATVNVAVIESQLPPGSPSGEITVTSNGGNATVIVNYLPPPSPGAEFVGIFSDATGSDCNIVDQGGPSLVQVYVVHHTTGAAGIQFMAAKPNCWNGATYLSDTPAHGVSVGNTQNGIAVAYGACLSGPVQVVTISYFGTGVAPTCCNYAILPDPNLSSGRVESIDCSFVQRTLATQSAWINQDEGACPCGGSVQVPVLNVTPTALNFGATSDVLPLNINNIGIGVLDFSLISSQPWVTPASLVGAVLSQSTAPVDIMVDRSVLAPGTHTATVDISSNGGSASVTVSVEMPPAQLSFTPSSLFFALGVNQQPLTIFNFGVFPLDWNIVSDSPWLSVDPASGTDGAIVDVNVDRSQLGHGTFLGQLTITSNGGGGTVDVIVENATAPLLWVNPTFLSFSNSFDTRDFFISNRGIGTLQWSTSANVPWITLSETIGSGDATITASIDFAQLPPGPQSGTIDVASNGGDAAIAITFTPPPPVFGGIVGIYADRAGFSCNLAADTPGLIQYHIVHTLTAGATGVQFSAPKPTCFTGVFLSDQNNFGAVLGDTQTGVSVGYGACLPGPVAVLAINYFVQDVNTPRCCEYPVLPHPSLSAIIVTDCTFEEGFTDDQSGFINGDFSCSCGIIAVEESTWGHIKSLYASPTDNP